MKKIFAIVLSVLSMTVAAQERIMVLSDPHVLPQSLLDTSSLAFHEMMDSQRKMIDMSEPAFIALVDTALAYHPDLVLIPGDLTKDSEKASHALVVAQLNRLQQAGIPTLLIPGNHDIGGLTLRINHSLVFFALKRNYIGKTQNNYDKACYK